MRLWLLFETRGLFSGHPLARLVVHPVTHENVWGRDRDRRDVRFDPDPDPDPDVPGCCSIFGTVVTSEVGGRMSEVVIFGTVL